tara:strand:+ start:1636 stop:2184 length:549 start_codon:yes stop_codon:yes gene_type:complete
MGCTLERGRELPCKAAFGGIKTIFFANYGGITGVTIDASTKEATYQGTTTWYEFNVKGNSSLETTVTSSRENGTTFYTQTLNMTLTFLEAKTVQLLREITLSRPYVAVEDYYGNTFLCGLENGMEVTGGTIVTGAAAGDLSGFTLTLEGMEESAPYFLSTPIVASNDQVSPTPFNVPDPTQP